MTSADLPALLNGWVKMLDERGVIHIEHQYSDFSLEFRKKVYKRTPDQLLSRFRNADLTKQYFPNVLSYFQEHEIDHELELTPKLRKHRAIVVALDLDDESAFERGAELVEHALKAVGYFDDGTLIAYGVGEMSKEYEIEVFERAEEIDNKLISTWATRQINKLRAEK